jgi:light-regulated signal transduction histidine kinase (bacteriophytochrome)
MQLNSMAEIILKIHISVQEDKAGWTFAVKDNGIGIDKKYQKQIFGVFRRLHTRKEYPGTGLGLSICQKIIERHGKKLWVDPKPGMGSTFYFIIPKNVSYKLDEYLS